MKKLLHFTADWCAPCKRIKPIIEEFVSENPDIEYVVVDVDTQLDMVNKYNIMSVPTLISIVDDEVASRWSGVADKIVIEQLFK